MKYYLCILFDNVNKTKHIKKYVALFGVSYIYNKYKKLDYVHNNHNVNSYKSNSIKEL